MTTQEAIRGAWLRASCAEQVGVSGDVAWFGAGAFAHRLAESVHPDMLACVERIFDDNASGSESAIAGIPVVRPAGSEPPARIILATDTHTAAFRKRIGELWGGTPQLIDPMAPPSGSWVDPGDPHAGFARTHPERWREAIGRAQIELEGAGAPVDARDRWRRAHAILTGADQDCLFDADERERFGQWSAAAPLGAVAIVRAPAPIESDPYWRATLERHHAAVSPDGAMVAITMAPRVEFPCCPCQAGGALWIPHEPTNIVEALYGQDAPGDKRYTVRFDDGSEMPVTATRERTHADLRGSAELARYERFMGDLPRGGRVLDCATGTGPGAAMLAAQGMGVTGVDVSEDAIRFARRRYPGIEFVRASAMSLPFPDGAFDAVVSIETIEHCADPVAALRELARVCSPDGALCLTTPDEGGCDSPFHEVELGVREIESALDRVLGAGAWASERRGGEHGWHALVIRRAREAAF
ncbi:MAG: class I SAM-dependent methyltransferase [Phycisphaeraceae bacterium]|nr:class I SAM-dependent methyltransferase [Phycisphaeraceae bacterium]